MRVADISNYDYDVDVRDPDGWIPAFKAEGIEGVIIGSQWMAAARWQLAKCQEQGMPVVATYAEPDVDGAISLAKEAGARFVCLVYEPGSIQDHEEFWSAVVAVQDAGLLPVLYGNYYDIFWAASDARFHGLPLWFASYFNDRRVLTSVDFWPVLWGHQFTSTWMIAGKNRDVNETFLLEDDMSPEERELLFNLARMVLAGSEEGEKTPEEIAATIRWRAGEYASKEQSLRERVYALERRSSITVPGLAGDGGNS